MSRAPFVMAKSDSAFSRRAEIFDTTLGWRFINPAMVQRYGVDSMPETAENVAREYSIERVDQDAFAHRSQLRAAEAVARGFFAREIVPVGIPPPPLDSDATKVSTKTASSSRLSASATSQADRSEGTLS